jgi:hypothetical protein
MGRSSSPSFKGVQWRVTEKAVEHSGDRLMAVLGFFTIRFSQARASRQTPGIPDRRYYRSSVSDSRLQSMAVWWEAKTPNGKQSVEQKMFQALVESCGEEYVVGDLSALENWCAAKGLARWTPGGELVVRRQRSVTLTPISEDA